MPRTITCRHAPCLIPFAERAKVFQREVGRQMLGYVLLPFNR